MLSAGRFRISCSRCRPELLQIFEYGFAGSLAARLPPLRTPSRLNSTTTRSPNASRHRRLGARRLFSTTRPLRGSPVEPEPNTRSTSPEEVELFVRQAKEAFGDTLPPDYLSEEEYKVYERLFGPPLRETTPEDVGFPFGGQGGDMYDEDPPTLFREMEDGTIEEVEYTANESVEEVEYTGIECIEEVKYTANESVTVDGVEELEQPEEAELQYQEDLPIDPRLDYLSVLAKNRREYDALVKLRNDFEAASLLALQEAQETTVQEAIAAVEADQRLQEEEAAPESEQQLQDDKEAEERELYRERLAQQWERHDDGPRLHELTVEGKFKTSPATIYLPKETFVQPITELLSRADPGHLKEAAESAFGGPGLPFSARTPPTMRNAKQKGIALGATQSHMSEIEADAYIASVLPSVYATATSILVEVRKRLGSDWLRGLLKKNDGKGPGVLDAGGSGAGLLAWNHIVDAEWEVMRSQGETTTLDPPPGKKTAIIGSNFLRHRVSRMLHDTTFLPRLPDYLHSGAGKSPVLDAPTDPHPRKTYDVIIMSHMLMPLDRAFKRKVLLDNLWAHLNPEGGVLIVLEKGHPRGFEAVADARARILHEFITTPDHPEPEGEDRFIEPEGSEPRTRREPGMIVAPCTNHKACPMYRTPGYSHGRKDFCHFSQRFIRPPFLQKIVAPDRPHNHEDINFSYVVVRRGGDTRVTTAADPTIVPVTQEFPQIDDSAMTSNSNNNNGTSATAAAPWQGKYATERAFAGYGSLGDGEARPSMLSLPRNVLPPLKGRGHVTLDLCTPDAVIERWVVPRSFGKQAYHNARKARWGDLWALGAKTRTARRVRAGAPGDESDLARPLGDAPRRNEKGRRTAHEMDDDDDDDDELEAGPGGSGLMEDAEEEGSRRGRKALGGRRKDGRETVNELLEQVMREEARVGDLDDDDDLDEDDLDGDDENGVEEVDLGRRRR